MTSQRAIIVGAGVAGLAAAWWLRRAGWECQVIERADDLRAGGYVMGLSGPGHAVARRMGILPALEAQAIPPGRSVYRDRTGRKLMTIRHGEHLDGLDYLIIRRGDLVLALRGLLADTPIQLGTTITDVDNHADGVKVRLSDGTSAEADLLIAADGVRSTLRASVIGEADPYRFLGYRYAAYDVTGAPDATEDFTGYVAPGRTCEFYCLSEGRRAALHVWATDRPLGPGSRTDLPALAALHADDAPEVRSMIAAAITEENRAVIDDLLMVETSRWSHNRIVLLGDAAHCITLISGQGAGMALCGAAALADALAAEAGIERVLAAYEARMRPPITRLQMRSRSIARWFVPRTPLAYLVRNTIVRLLPRAALTRYFRKSISSELEAAGMHELRQG